MTGRVVLVGGGPGADDLITVRGLDRLLAADVVVVDRLAPVGLLARLGDDVEVIDAARGPDRRTLTHDEIVAVLVDRARAGKVAVRLKGGDPFVFAHGAQEVEACVAAGVEVEVVPGVTSVTAAPVLAGVPLTAVDGAVGFTVVSGHRAPGDPSGELDWSAIAAARTTVVVLMGMRHLGAIAERLVADGVPPDVRATCIADASLATQRSVQAPLSGIAAAVHDAGLANPAVVVIEAASRRATRRVLVLGGSRSGKSAVAEAMAASAAGAGGAVTYVATAAPRPDDAEWADRVERHRARRPSGWRTLETGDLAGALRDGSGVLLVDSITTWLARAMDDCGVWDDTADPAAAERALAALVDELVAAWARASAVVVSDEVGSGIVPGTRSGRRFRDALGELNQRLAAAADEVHLVTAGLARRLEVTALARALSLFTVVPVRVPPQLAPGEARRALVWLPAVGAALGATSALPLVATRAWAHGATLVGAVVAIGLLALLTRGLHLDGLADTADGLGSRAPAERALTIMRQSDIGPFGVLAIVFAVGTDVAALAAVPRGPWAACAALAVAALTGRLAALHAAGAAPAHPDGFGALVHRPDGHGTVAAGTVLALAAGAVLALAVGADPWLWAGSQAVALLLAGLFRRHTSRRLGGTTGDVYGALIELATAITLVGLCLR